MSKESAVVKACRDYLTLRGAFVWRNQTGMIPIADPKYGKRYIRQGVKGSADIIGVLPGGRIVCVECKKPLGPRGGTNGSVQSPDQIEFQREVQERGGVYVVARGLDDLAPIFDKTN